MPTSSPPYRVLCPDPNGAPQGWIPAASWRRAGHHLCSPCSLFPVVESPGKVTGEAPPSSFLWVPRSKGRDLCLHQGQGVKGSKCWGPLEGTERPRGQWLCLERDSGLPRPLRNPHPQNPSARAGALPLESLGRVPLPAAETYEREMPQQAPAPATKKDLAMELC